MGYIDNTNASGTYFVGSLVGFVGNCILGPRCTFYKKTLSKLANYSKKLKKFQDRKKTAKGEKSRFYTHDRDHCLHSDSDKENQKDIAKEDDVEGEQEDFGQFMSDLQLKFPELKPLNHKEILSVLNMYDNHLQ